MIRTLCACLVASAMLAAQAADPLADARTVLLVRDGRWADREATRFAAAYGGELASLRSDLARVLYRSSSFDGIDLARPALLAMRPGRAPLVAIIPITDRNRFLAGFGAVDGSEAPLVRVGDRDGTVVYRQNDPGGELEYRLLVAANVAYLARTADECRRLAAGPALATDPTLAPLELSIHGDGLTDPWLPGASFLAALPELPSVPGELARLGAVAHAAWAAIAGQTAALRLSLRSDAQGDLVLGLRLDPRADTALAGWIVAQRPASERLASQVRSDDTVLMLAGRLALQGQAESWALDQVETVRRISGRSWHAGVDAAYRELCTLSERSGAWALAIERRGAVTSQIFVLEHPRAVEAAQGFATLAGAVAAVAPAPLQFAGGSGHAVAGAVIAAADRHLLRVDGGNAARRAADLIPRLEESGSLDDAPALAVLWTDLLRAWSVPPPSDGGTAAPLELRGALRVTDNGALAAQATVPLGALGAALGRIRAASAPARD